MKLTCPDVDQSSLWKKFIWRALDWLRAGPAKMPLKACLVSLGRGTSLEPRFQAAAAAALIALHSPASHSPPNTQPPPREKQCCSLRCWSNANAVLSSRPTSSLRPHVSFPPVFNSSIEAFSSQLTLCTQRTTAFTTYTNGRLAHPSSNLLPKIIQQLFLPSLRAQAPSTGNLLPAI
jgi:hypothetical protein